MNEQLPDLLQVLYPFNANHWQSPHGSLHYIDEGEGEPIVFLHGNPSWSFLYRDLVLGLRGRFRCLALDHLGCGLSDKPAAGPYTLAAHIERACSWIESLQLKRFRLVVHDWGGAIGFGVADRMADRIISIHVLNTAAFVFKPVPRRIALCRIPLAGTLAIRGGNLFAIKATELTTVQPLAQAVRDGYLWPYRSWADRVAIDAFVRDIPTSPRHRSWATLQAIESSLSRWRDQPVQILWGMQDWCFHTEVLKRWRELLPSAEVHEFVAAGHYITEDVGPQLIERIADFAAQRL